MKKVTFTIDDRTASAIRAYAAAEGKAQSAILREAVAAYGEARDKVPAAEQARRLAAIAEYRRRLDAAAGRSHAAVERELAVIRASRRRGYRRSARTERRRR